MPFGQASTEYQKILEDDNGLGTGNELVTVATTGANYTTDKVMPKLNVGYVIGGGFTDPIAIGAHFEYDSV